MKYSIDTSAILDGWNRYYPPDVFPALWSRLEALIRAGDLRATEEVSIELERKDDLVYKWSQKNPELFVLIDSEIQPIVSDILRDYEKLVDTRTNRSAADPFVIALAQLNGAAVVTGEVRTGSLKRPNIPDVCDDLGIRSVSLLELIREQGWAFTC